MMPVKNQKTVIRPITNRLVLVKFHLEEAASKLEELGLKDEASKLMQLAEQIEASKNAIKKTLLKKLEIEK